MADEAETAVPSRRDTDRYSVVLVRAVMLGIFTGIFGLAYLVAVELSTEWIWGDDRAGEGWFSGGPWAAAIPIISGLLVGVMYRTLRLPSRFPGFIDELQGGHVDPKTAPGAIGIAVISLVGGASLGPEAPLGTAGGAAGTWLARRAGDDADRRRQLTFIGISGAFGGLLSTPIGGPLLAFELEHDQTHDYYYSNLVPGMIAGGVSFGIMWPVVGAPFKGLLTIPHEAFASWMLLAGVGLGAAGAITALVVGRIMNLTVGAMRTLDERPVLRGLVGGAAIGTVGVINPLTLFSGQTSLPAILADFERIGVLTLVVLALLKAVTLGASLGGGFYGGPIFPTLFIGAVIGVATHALVPAIPLGLAVGGVMAALGSAIALLPLSMAVLAGIMLQSGLEYFGAIAIASATAYAIRITAAKRTSAGDLQRAST
jgi:H+/Cl- antiporter ClcA